MENAPLVIAGPSGSGKTYLVERLMERYPFKLALSSMTRPPRDGEEHLVDNEFLTDDEFDEAIASGDFFQVNQFLGQRYGYRRSYFEAIWRQGQIPVVIYFTPVIEQIFTAYPESFGIFLLPNSLDLLASRMRKRGDPEFEIAKRLASAEAEIAAYNQHAALFGYTARIANDLDINSAIAAIVSRYKLE